MGAAAAAFLTAEVYIYIYTSGYGRVSLWGDSMAYSVLALHIRDGKIRWLRKK